MELVGRLCVDSVTDVLVLLEATRQTGVLRLDGDSELWFDAGAVTFASYPGCASLRAALVGYRIIDEAQWPSVVAPGGSAVDGTTANGTTANGTTANGTTANGTTANGTNDAAPAPDDDPLTGVTRQRLRTVVRERIVDTISPFLGRRDVPCAFEAGDFHELGRICRVPVDVLVADAARRRDEWRDIAKLVPALTCVPRLSHFAAYVPPEYEWVLAHVDGHRSVAEVADATHASAYAVCSALRRLVLAGAVAIGAAV